MIYGKGSKGNYPKLSFLAQKLPVFPEAQNKRSMLFIENLCEFVGQLILSGCGGVWFPQNGEYSNTGELVRTIAKVHGKKIYLSQAGNFAVAVGRRMPIKKIRGLCSKAFDSSYYDMGLSVYKGLDYQKISLEESIWLTERNT